MQGKRNIKIKLWVTFLFCVAFSAFSHFTTNRLEKGISVNNIGTIEKVLHKLQKESDAIISHINTNYPDSIIPDLDNIWPKELQKKRVSLVVTDTAYGNILYWSNNLPATKEQLKNITTKPKYFFLGNGSYIGQSFNIGSFKYITLILIEREYYYQNQFLKDRANEVFNFPRNIIILPLGSDIGTPVNGIDGAPIFIVNSDIPSVATSNLSLLFRWLTILFLCVFIVLIFCNSGLYKKSLWFLPIAFLVLLGLRIFIFVNPDYFNGDLYIFSPMLYADSELIPSLGDLLLHVLFVLIYIKILFSAKDSLRQKFSALVKKDTVYIIAALLLALLLCAIQYVMGSLAFNSEISFKIYKMNDVTLYTFVAYFIVGVIFSILCILAFIYSYIFSALGNVKLLLTQGIIAIITMLAIMGFKYDTLLLIAVLVFIYYIFLKKQSTRITLSLFLGITLSVALYVSFSIVINTTQREHNKREIYAQSLLSERDPVAEMLLKDIENKLSLDPYVQNILNSDEYDNPDLYRMLIDKYFRGYFQRYDIRYNVCRGYTNLHIIDEGKEENCLDFYMQEKENIGIPLSGSSHFWFMNNYWGRIHYFGYFKYTNNGDTTYLFLELYSKPEVEAIGYPELLKLESKGVNFEVEGYSYAKYSDRKLVSKFGSYDYRFELMPNEYKKEGFSETNGFSHYTYSTDEGNAVILSLPKLGLYGAASMFSYTFVIFIVFLFILFTLAGLRLEITTNRNSYRWKFSIVILIGIIGSLTSITIAMLAYNISQSEKKNMETIQNKMQSIIIELDQYLFEKDTITKTMVLDLDPILVRLSNSFYTDLNIYDIGGNLVASSRNEIFEKNLVGTKMNRDAFYALATEKQAKFIHLENIGEMSFFSSYTTYYNKESEAIAYLNLPYFDNQSEFRNDLLSLTGAIMNIYIFLIVIGIALSIFISNQITQPLDLVRKKMAKLNFADKPEPIDYKGNNELGDLVREYNRMVGELAASAKVMAENERELAWREMARQIAHEIKNPLTPMKLNIQLALRMKEQERAGWQHKMDEAMSSTLEQIDILSQTASEFSDFARTGMVKLEPVNINMAIESSILLFSGYKNVKINYEPVSKDCFVKANKEQLQRVFTNLIKNSVQATEDLHNPQITISVKARGTTYVIKLADNGTGISQEELKNLFKPNFTTKSGGTGLGLAISKGIIESFGGIIVFIPQENGACFEIELPAN